MADIAAQLVSVERVLWSGRATLVIAQTVEGTIGVMAGHQPMLGQLVENGTVVIKTADGGRKVAACQGGFLSVAPDKITVLAEYATWSDEINTQELEAALASDDATVKARAEAEEKALRQANK